MNIGVSSYSFWKHNEQTGCGALAIATLAQEIGYEGIEYIQLDKMFPEEEPLALAQRIREHCGRIGLPVIAYAVDADFLEEGQNAVQALREHLRVAKELGAPLLRHDISRGENTKDWRGAIEIVAPLVRQVAQEAAALGIRTCSENHGLFFQDAERVESLILRVDHPNYGWLVDIGNFACADDDSIHAVDIAAPYAVHVHAKDFLIREAEGGHPGEGWFASRNGRFLRGTVAGHGQIPLRRCIQRLQAAGYDGWLSYEFEGPEDNLYALRAGLAALRRLIQDA